MFTELLSLALKSPDFAGDLVTIVLTDDTQVVDPRAGALNSRACRRLEARLGGSRDLQDILDGLGPDSPAMGPFEEKESGTFYELHYNAKSYLSSLMRVEKYPPDLRARAEAEFPPLGHDSRWEAPKSFRPERGLRGWLRQSAGSDVEARLRHSPTGSVIIINRPSSTELLYPWQQAISAFRALLGAGPRFSDISARYVPVGKTKMCEVSYRDGSRSIVKLPVLLEPGLERMFEFQTPSLPEEKPFFDEFVSSLR